MPQQDLILKFEIEKGLSPKLESIARALEEWAAILQIAAGIVEPDFEPVVELIGVQSGSQVFKLALRHAEQFGERIKAGGAEYPLVSRAAITLAGLVSGTVVVASITNMVTPDPRIPKDQMAVFQSMNRSLAASVELQEKNTKFYDTLSKDPAFKAVKILRDDRVQVYEVPRDEFAIRSGLWASQTDETAYADRPKIATWDVVLIKPALIPEPRRWTFARDGLEFTALMADKSVLEAIHRKTLPIQIAEGVMMKVEVQYSERFDGRAWVPISTSRQVKKVLAPLPPPPSVPLFPTTGNP